MRKPTIWLWIALLQGLVATLGSLAASLVWHLSACILCWYQRVMMFPLTFLLIAAIIWPKTRFARFLAPLSFVGAGIALYNHLLQIGVYTEPTAICSATKLSCAVKQFSWGPLTFPALSFIAFVIIGVCLLLDARARYRHRV